MAKDAYYFSHDSNARNDEKIIALRMALGSTGYGIYWMLVEKLRESTDYKCSLNVKTLAFELHEDPANIEKVIKGFKLFIVDEEQNQFFSKSLCDRMELRNENKRTRSMAGLMGNMIKHGHLTKDQMDKMTDDEIKAFANNLKNPKLSQLSQNSLATATLSQDLANKEKEKKEKEIKEKEINAGIYGGSHLVGVIYPNAEDISSINLSEAEIENTRRAIKLSTSIDKTSKDVLDEFSSFKIIQFTGSNAYEGRGGILKHFINQWKKNINSGNDKDTGRNADKTKQIAAKQSTSFDNEWESLTKKMNVSSGI